LPAPSPLPLARAQAAAVAQFGDEAALLLALGHDPAGADLLAQRSGLDASRVMAGLSSLELAGLIERLPGGQFQRGDVADG